MGAVSDLYYAVLDAWNRHDADDYAALFANDGYVVGFDGSEMNGTEQIEQSLSTIFADHETGRYVAEVRAERAVSDNVAIVAAVAGLVPPGKSDVNPELNAIQTLVAKHEDGRWRIVQFQNTPAQFHGRPKAAEALTNELRALV
ncbi:MAG: DUF4440 domain-containing protein [Candidatus Rokuibacteriota bacterium]|nr:MAG: DUF4440 domain-containing protein [Candidatus Rokubacteria bacterium]